MALWVQLLIFHWTAAVVRRSGCICFLQKVSKLAKLLITGDVTVCREASSTDAVY